MTPKRKYRCILIDPPWQEQGGGKCIRGAQRHYDLMTFSDIRKTIQASPYWRPAAEAHIWVWTTVNHLAHGIGLIEALGFRYVSKVEWIKMKNFELVAPERCMTMHQLAREATQLGLGQYFRHATEPLLFGVRGDAMVPTTDNRPPSVLYAERRNHSQKPDEQYKLIERVSPGPRCEYFARQAWPGWDRWGMEAPE